MVKKLSKFVTLLLSVMVLAIALTGCEVKSERLERIKQIKPEVSYGYTAVGNNSLTIDFKVYNYQKLACELVRNKEENTYPYGQKLAGNYMYFYYQYDSRKTKKGSNNKYVFDVGLFRVNINTAKCELVYDFKSVSVNASHNPNVGAVVDENRAVLNYNGTISIFNLNTLKITESIEDCPYYLSEFYDYIKFDKNTLYYYELDGYSFKLHKLENASGEFVNRFENYIYTSSRGGVWNDCFDLTTNTKIDKDVLLKKMEEVDNKKYEEEYQNRTEEDAYIIDGKKYYLDLYDELTIYSESEYIRNEYNEIDYNENREVLYTIDEEFLNKNSQVFNDLYYLWDKNPRQYEVNYFWVIDGKLYVAVSASYSWAAQTPSYVYQCDLENNKVYYVGFIDEVSNPNNCVLQLH